MTLYARANKEARAMLHCFLEHRRSALGVNAKQPVQAKDFFPVDVRILIQFAGWQLEQLSMIGHTATLEEMVAKCVRAERKIVLLSTLSEETKRYTLAHELGHALLHADIPDCNGGSLPRVTSMLSPSRRKGRNDFGPVEREAEVFAREVLMPEKAVRRYFSQLFQADRIDATSGPVAKLAPEAHQKWRSKAPLDLEDARKRRKEVAAELATWRTPSAMSLAEFFGVSRAATAARLVGFQLVS